MTGPPRTVTARSRAVSRVSTATTRAPVVARRICTAKCPSPPTPITTAVAVGPSLRSERRTAWYGVSAASVSGAAWTRSSPSGIGHQMPGGRHQQVLSHATVEPEPTSAAGHRGQVRPFAVGLEALQAVPTRAATPGAHDGDRLAELDAGDADAERVDPPGVLVAERERRIPRQRSGLEVVHQVQVRVARPSSTDLHHHLARTRLWHRDVSRTGSLFQDFSRKAFIVRPPTRRCRRSPSTLRRHAESDQGHPTGDLGRWSLHGSADTGDRGLAASTDPRRPS